MIGEALVRQDVLPMNLLVVDDEQYARQLCADVAKQSGMKVTTVSTSEEAISILENSAVDILITDLKLPKSSGLDLLQRVHDQHREVAVIVLTQYGTIDSAVAATRLGALDYVTKPVRVEELRSRLERAAHAVELQQENRLLREKLRTWPGFGGLIGVSSKMQRVYKMIEKVSLHEYPVLILGESGTGKEMVARSIHYAGPRKDRPFAPVDCSSLVPTLIESELFGYVKGAHRRHSGQARTIGGRARRYAFPRRDWRYARRPASQALASFAGTRGEAGGLTERRQINVRIIAATNRDLEAAIRTAAFRQDLYFRLNVVQMKLPALRDRKSDIPLLVTSFLDKFSRMHGTTKTITDEAMRRLITYDWPGNVRELENAIARSVALGSGPTVEMSDLPSNLHYGTSERVPDHNEILPLEELERRAILKTLGETSGDKLAAARMLGIGKTTLYRKLKQYSVQHEEN
jgi:DNA-binding NtrC family response regulator